MKPLEWLPPIVAARFRMEALERDPSSIVAIAPDGRIGSEALVEALSA